ncbi:hypothetical protein [Paenibacillus sp. 1P03SA]|uniref:hypothetical protein n=1 Tax=Paenibacillus sp. 1P03SA TaxID=3132294 RepID=UPI0039A189A8
MSTQAHELFVVYHEGTPAFTGFNGQNAYDSLGGANRAISHIARAETNRLEHNAWVDGRPFDREQTFKEIKGQYSVLPYSRTLTQLNRLDKALIISTIDEFLMVHLDQNDTFTREQRSFLTDFCERNIDTSSPDDLKLRLTLLAKHLYKEVVQDGEIKPD